MKADTRYEIKRFQGIQRLGLKLQTSEETTGDEYIRLETSTYEWVSCRRRVHTSA